MRKITKEAIAAFNDMKPFSKSNTTVLVTEDNTATLALFGNIIAKQEDGVLSITTAGWPTSTTKERLNALPGVHIEQKKGVWYLNGLFWDGSWVIIE